MNAAVHSTLKPARAKASWLHDEVGRRLLERSQCLQSAPELWLDWCPSVGGAVAHLAWLKLWPRAGCRVVECDTLALSHSLGLFQPSIWQKWRPGARRHSFSLSDSAELLGPQKADVVCANLPFSDPGAATSLLGRWLEVTQAGGSLFFSSLGPDTAIELQRLYQDMLWGPAAADALDLHGLGDQILASGWVDPVVDSERLQLTYSHVDDLLRDLRAFGRNLHPKRFSGLRGRAWLQALRDRLRQQPLVLTIEMLFAHAVKPYQTAGRGGVDGVAVTQVDVEQLRSSLRGSKSKSGQ